MSSQNPVPDFYLTVEQVATLRALKEQGMNAEGNYSHIYAYVASILPPDSQRRAD